jgi:hypothetical protein
VSRSDQFGPGHYPTHANDQEILAYLMRIHTGSRADLRRVPYDTRYDLKRLRVANLTSSVPRSNAIALAYARRRTPFPPIIMDHRQVNPLDGNHRVVAASLRGDQWIRAYVPVRVLHAR